MGFIPLLLPFPIASFFIIFPFILLNKTVKEGLFRDRNNSKLVSRIRAVVLSPIVLLKMSNIFKYYFIHMFNHNIAISFFEAVLLTLISTLFISHILKVAFTAV